MQIKHYGYKSATSVDKKASFQYRYNVYPIPHLFQLSFKKTLLLCSLQTNHSTQYSKTLKQAGFDTQEIALP